MNRSNLAIAVAILAAALVACASNPTPRPGKENVTKSKRAKLIVQKEKGGSETGIYQQNLELREPLMLGGKPVEGQRRFELSNLANYPGPKPQCISERNAIMILHEKPVRSGWQYPPSAKVVWVIDGQETKSEKTLQDKIQKEDGKWWESLITRPSCETLQQFSLAKTAEIHINNAVIKLQDEEIAALKEFVATLGFSPQ